MEAKKPDYWQKREGAEYMIRQLNPGEYEITKWTRGDTPAEIYVCKEMGKKWSCNCPVRGKCKHIDMVKKWIEGGKKPYYDVSDLPRLAKKFL